MLFVICTNFSLISDKIEYGTFTTPICNSTDTTLSAFKLINALCMGCVENMKTLQGLLNDLFYYGNLTYHWVVYVLVLHVVYSGCMVS